MALHDADVRERSRAWQHLHFAAVHAGDWLAAEANLMWDLEHLQWTSTVRFPFAGQCQVGPAAASEMTIMVTMLPVYMLTCHDCRHKGWD